MSTHNPIKINQIKYFFIFLLNLTYFFQIYSNNPSSRPNIILIMVDDMNWDTVGCYAPTTASDLNVTPNIDLLATEGIRFERAYNTVAVCQPSRQIFMTGKYPQNIGALGFTDIDENITTLGEVLHSAGYWNGIFCKEHHLTPEHKYAWDHVGRSGDMHNGRNTETFYRETKRFINKATNQNKPFFLMANSEDPHRPFHGSTDEANKFSNQLANGDFSIPSKVYTKDEVSTIPNWFPQGGNSNNQNQIRTDLSQYYSSARRADDSIGRILDAVRDTGNWGNTIVMFMTDNGMAFPNAKWQTYHQSTRTPLIIRWPGHITPGEVDTKHFISSIDYMPTLLEAVGLGDQIPNDLDGTSFLPLLNGAKQNYRNEVVTAHYESVWYSDGANADMIQNQIRRGFVETEPGSKKYTNEFNIRCFQDKEYAYIYNAWHDNIKAYNIGSGITSNQIRSAGEGNPSFINYRDFIYYRVPEEFYDLKNDPDMLNNLIHDDNLKDKISSFRNKMSSWMNQYSDPKKSEYQQFLTRTPVTIPERRDVPNLVYNPGFEDDGTVIKDTAPMGWSYRGDALALETRYMDGNYLLCNRHYVQNNAQDDYEVDTFQTIPWVPDGTYSLKAKARKSGAFFEAAHLYVEGYGGARKTTVIPSSPELQTIVLRNIKVTSGECKIGLWTKTYGGRWPKPTVYLDDLEFFLDEEDNPNEINLPYLEDFETNTGFSKIQIISAPSQPSGSEGLHVGSLKVRSTSSKARTNKSIFESTIPVNQQTSFFISGKVGLNAMESGDIRIRFRLKFDNGDSKSSGWIRLSNSAHNTMEFFRKPIKVKENYASIQSIELQCKQVELNMPEQILLLDELRLE